MRVLIIGFGSMGKRHARNARELGHVVTVWDENNQARRAAIDDGFPLADFDPCWLAEKDAVVIATPAHTHFDVAMRLQRRQYAGPLFVEKPLDVSLVGPPGDIAHAEWWRQWPHPTQMVGYNWRFMEKVEKIDSALGCDAATEFAAATLTDMSTWPGSGYAGALLEASHDIDLARWFLGGGLRCADVERRDGDWWKLALGAMYGSGTAKLILWPNASMPLRFAAVASSLGMHVYCFDLGQTEHRAALEQSYMAEMRAFLGAAQKGEPVPEAATFEDGLAVIKIVEQAEALAKQGEE